MNDQTNEFLHYLAWNTDGSNLGPFRLLTDSFESWAYPGDLMRQAERLAQRQLIERDPKHPRKPRYRLTHEGLLHTLGGHYPPDRWARKWDGQWRMVVFDISKGHNTLRQALLRYLRQRGFGCLQDSVWITPDPMDEERRLLRREMTNVEQLILLNTQPCAGETDQQLVAGAWKFSRIHTLYSKYLAILKRCPQTPLTTRTAARRLKEWATTERWAWLEVIELDPLLPAPLLPRGYMGKRVWNERARVLSKAARLLTTFTQA